LIQLWTDQFIDYGLISESLNITSWELLNASLSDSVQVNLQEYLLSLNSNGSSSFKLLPYALEPLTQREQPATFLPAVQSLGIDAITVNVMGSATGQNESPACPVFAIEFSVGRRPGSFIPASARDVVFSVERKVSSVIHTGTTGVLRVGDSVAVSFGSQLPPERCKVCGRYREPQLSTDGSYYILHEVEAGDAAGPCSFLAYYQLQSGILQVYEKATDLLVDPSQGTWRA